MSSGIRFLQIVCMAAFAGGVCAQPDLPKPKARPLAGVIGEGAASFTTISEQDLKRRADFAIALQELTPGPLASALLGGIDFRLGILHEALPELEDALRLIPGDPSAQHALESVHAALTEEPR